MQSQWRPPAAQTTGTASSGLSPSVFILDVGTRTIKSGVHTAAAPHHTPSLVGTPKYPRCLPGPSPPAALPGGVVVGHEAQRQRGLLRLSHPVQRGGAVVDWDNFRPLLRQSIKDGLTSPPSASGGPRGPSQLSDGSSVVYSLVESPFAARPQRARVADLLFSGAEHCSRAAGLFCGVGPLLALYATGQVTGLVVDVGDAALRTAAAVDGFVLPLCLQNDTSGAAGSAMTTYLTRLLYQSGVLGPGAAAAQRGGRPITAALTCSSPESVPHGAGAGTAQERELVYAVKEACCAVSPTPLFPAASVASVGASAATTTAPSAAELNAALLNAARCAQPAAADDASATTRRSLTLPDGHTVEVGHIEAQQAAEVLFYPSLLGLEGPGVVDAVLNAVLAAPSGVQAALLGNIVLTGGATCVPGFAKRVFQELQQRIDATGAISGLRGQRVRVTAPEQRAHAGWLGASFVAQLSTFASDMVVTRAAYEEEGEAALARKVLA